MCLFSVWSIRKSQQEQEKLRQEILDRIDLIMEKGSVQFVDQGKIMDQGKMRTTVRKKTSMERQSVPNPSVGYSFLETGISPPSASRDLALSNQS